MAVSQHIIERVQEALGRLGTACPMEEVVGLCPELTWNQVFLAIDSLSRTGLVRITLDSSKAYRVQAFHAVTAGNFCVAPSP